MAWESGFSERIQSLILEAQEKTAHNDTITLTIAANYGGRWDLLEAIKSWQDAHPGESVNGLDESALSAHLAWYGTRERRFGGGCQT